MAWNGKGNYETAIADYTEAIRLNPTESAAYNSMAWLYATCPKVEYGNGSLAVEYATKACELTAWKVGSYIDTLAAEFAESGDWDQARK